MLIEASSSTPQSYKGQVLSRINVLRAERNMTQLQALPQAVPGSWDTCVLGVALGSMALLDAIQNPFLRGFERRFEAEMFPELISPDRSYTRPLFFRPLDAPDDIAALRREVAMLRPECRA